MNINQVFSDLILQQKSADLMSLDFSLNAPLLRPLHPNMIKGLLQFMENPDGETVEPPLEGYFYSTFASIEEALQQFPSSTPVKATPFEMGSFLKSSTTRTLFDFPPFGAFLLSKEPLSRSSTKGVHNHLIPPFLNYAVSNDLWGPDGKWTRFHARLVELFNKKGLLVKNYGPGLYGLNSSAQKLENYGITGIIESGMYTLCLPWTFSLSALNEVERVISQEF